MVESTLSPPRRPRRKRKDVGAGESLALPGHALKGTVKFYKEDKALQNLVSKKNSSQWVLKENTESASKISQGRLLKKQK